MTDLLFSYPINTEVEVVSVRRLRDKIALATVFLVLLVVVRAVVQVGGVSETPYGALLISITNPLTFAFNGVLPQVQAGPNIFDPATGIALVVLPILGRIVAVLTDTFRIMARENRVLTEVVAS